MARSNTKKDIIFISDLPWLLELQDLMRTNPAKALSRVSNSIKTVSEKRPSGFLTVDEVLEVCYHAMNGISGKSYCSLGGWLAHIADKQYGAKERRMAALALIHYTTAPRKELLPLLGYKYTSGLSLSLQEAQNLINQEQRWANLWKEISYDLEYKRTPPKRRVYGSCK